MTDKAATPKVSATPTAGWLERVVSHLFTRRLKAWSARDAELSEKWWQALDAEDYEECTRLQYAMRKNWEGYREGG